MNVQKLKDQAENTNLKTCTKIKDFKDLYKLFLDELSNKGPLFESVNDMLHAMDKVTSSNINLTEILWTYEAAFKCLEILSDEKFQLNTDIQNIASSFFRQCLKFSPSLVGRAFLLRRVTVILLLGHILSITEAQKFEIRVTKAANQKSAGHLENRLAELEQLTHRIQFKNGSISEKLLQRAICHMSRHEKQESLDPEENAIKFIYLPIVEQVNSLSPGHRGNLLKIFSQHGFLQSPLIRALKDLEPMIEIGGQQKSTTGQRKKVILLSKKRK